MKKSGFKLKSGNSPLKLNIDLFGIGKGIGEMRRRKWAKKDAEEKEEIRQQDEMTGYTGRGNVSNISRR